LKLSPTQSIFAAMTSHEMFAIMPAALGNRILEEMAGEDKAFYRGILDGVAQARKVRTVYLERQPRSDRHNLIVSTLARPTMEPSAANILRTWFLKKQNQLLIDFLDALGVEHEKGVVEDLPEKVEDAKVKTSLAAKEQCTLCHDHENSPEFDYATYWPKIAHGPRAASGQPAKESP